METPVLYFYAEQALHASVQVDFPQGWITEWYPCAATSPVFEKKKSPMGGQSVRWDVKLLVNEKASLPQDKSENHYYQARATDAVPVQTELISPQKESDGTRRGGLIAEHEKFLFYRGVGTFPLPVTVQALGDNKVRVKNQSGGRVGGLLLLSVHDTGIGFKLLDDVAAGAATTTTLPEAQGKAPELVERMVKELTAAGLYEKEARACVNTWSSAWFGEQGSRLLYLVPRQRTDELLPLTVEPQPAETVRVLVGRHDFLTPEQEALAERQVQRSRAAQAELAATEKELSQIGRFTFQARQLAEKRLESRAAQK